MKITLEIPDLLLRRAETLAAANHKSLADFVTEALVAHIANQVDSACKSDEPSWMKYYGGLAHVKDEVQRMQREIDIDFGGVDLEDWK
ncbi:MAG: hypothetical protein HC853_10850 [Anaerolineae bacterium]|nr:hypothetical protein [Anaerolineae bacterium]